MEGLTPTIIQDAATGDVLTLAWSTPESLRITKRTNETWLWSRSRGELWHKGATSGNVQTLVTIGSDCDQDALLFRVIPQGPACHTGAESCWAPSDTGGILSQLDFLVGARSIGEGYTGQLLANENKRIKKIGEESAELVVALAKGTDKEVIAEAADLLYHMLVAVRARGIPFKKVLYELFHRHK